MSIEDFIKNYQKNKNFLDEEDLESFDPPKEQGGDQEEKPAPNFNNEIYGPVRSSSPFISSNFNDEDEKS